MIEFTSLAIEYDNAPKLGKKIAKTTNTALNMNKLVASIATLVFAMKNNWDKQPATSPVSSITHEIHNKTIEYL